MQTVMEVTQISQIQTSSAANTTVSLRAVKDPGVQAADQITALNVIASPAMLASLTLGAQFNVSFTATK